MQIVYSLVQASEVIPIFMFTEASSQKVLNYFCSLYGSNICFLVCFAFQLAWGTLLIIFFVKSVVFIDNLSRVPKRYQMSELPLRKEISGFVSRADIWRSKVMEKAFCLNDNTDKKIDEGCFSVRVSTKVFETML